MHILIFLGNKADPYAATRKSWRLTVSFYKHIKITFKHLCLKCLKPHLPFDGVDGNGPRLVGVCLNENEAIGSVQATYLHVGVGGHGVREVYVALINDK